MAGPANLPLCPECAAKSAAELATTFDALGSYKTAKELAEQVRKGEAVRHEVDVDDVLGEFEFDHFARCSYKHPCKRGFVVRARCGAVLALGRTCAANHVEGFEVIHNRLNIRKSALAFMKGAVERIDKVVRALEAAKKDEIDVVAQGTAIKRELPDLYSLLEAHEWRAEATPRQWFIVLESPDRAAVLLERARGLADSAANLGSKPRYGAVEQLQAFVMDLEAESFPVARSIDSAAYLLHRGAFGSVCSTAFERLHPDDRTARWRFGPHPTQDQIVGAEGATMPMRWRS